MKESLKKNFQVPNINISKLVPLKSQEINTKNLSVGNEKITFDFKNLTPLILLNKNDSDLTNLKRRVTVEKNIFFPDDYDYHKDFDLNKSSSFHQKITNHKFGSNENKLFEDENKSEFKYVNTNQLRKHLNKKQKLNDASEEQSLSNTFCYLTGMKKTLKYKTDRSISKNTVTLKVNKSKVSISVEEYNKIFEKSISLVDKAKLAKEKKRKQLVDNIYDPNYIKSKSPNSLSKAKNQNKMENKPKIKIPKFSGPNFHFRNRSDLVNDLITTKFIDSNKHFKNNDLEKMNMINDSYTIVSNSNQNHHNRNSSNLNNLSVSSPKNKFRYTSSFELLQSNQNFLKLKLKEKVLKEENKSNHINEQLKLDGYFNVDDDELNRLRSVKNKLKEKFNFNKIINDVKNGTNIVYYINDKPLKDTINSNDVKYNKMNSVVNQANNNNNDSLKEVNNSNISNNQINVSLSNMFIKPLGKINDYLNEFTNTTDLKGEINTKNSFVKNSNTSKEKRKKRKNYISKSIIKSNTIILNNNLKDKDNTEKNYLKKDNSLKHIDSRTVYGEGFELNKNNKLDNNKYNKSNSKDDKIIDHSRSPNFSNKFLFSPKSIKLKNFRYSKTHDININIDIDKMANYTLDKDDLNCERKGSRITDKISRNFEENDNVENKTIFTNEFLSKCKSTVTNYKNFNDLALSKTIKTKSNELEFKKNINKTFSHKIPDISEYVFYNSKQKNPFRNSLYKSNYYEKVKKEKEILNELIFSKEPSNFQKSINKLKLANLKVYSRIRSENSPVFNDIYTKSGNIFDISPTTLNKKPKIVKLSYINPLTLNSMNFNGSMKK